jgi:membrane protein DedA with SNARE-associated domain
MRRTPERLPALDLAHGGGGPIAARAPWGRVAVEIRCGVQSVIDAIRSLPPGLAYVVIGALVFGEAAVFVGFVLPGETAVVLGGFLASVGNLELTLLCVIVVACAIVGDTVGYEVGRLLGPRVLSLKPVVKHHDRLERAQQNLRERGGPAIFIGRFTAFLRAVMPGLAGLSRMRYPKFLLWNALGGLSWGIGFCLVGYFAGASYERVASLIGRGTAVVVGVIAVAALVVWRLRRRRRERAAEQGGEVESTGS